MQSSNVTSPAVPASWTVLSLLEWATGFLSARGFDESRLNAELLLAHVLSLRRLDLYLQFDRPLVSAELAQFKSNLQRRLAHEPIQYITGETEFMGIPLFVDHTVLIPRPETEQLVERTLETIRSMRWESPGILEIGTGSGNIAVALGHFLPGAVITSIDVSRAALDTAGRNITRNGISNVRLQQMDVFTLHPEHQRYDVIVSNPPYVPLTEFDSLQAEVREYEPRIATTDEGDGYRLIRRIVTLARALLNPEGALLLEIGYGQSADAVRIMENNGFAPVEVFQDYAGIPRIVRGRQGTPGRRREMP